MGLQYLFPDNTVLCNFGCVSRLDLLADIVRERARWTEAIAYEAAQSSRYIPAMTTEALAFLGTPIVIDDPDAVAQINRTRRVVFGGATNEPLKHLGEAETCYLLRNDAAYRESQWVTDDREALEYARQQGIFTRETIDLMAMAVSDFLITEHDGFELLNDMDRERPGLRLPTRPTDLRL